jgi:hypothetical protein
MRHNSRTSWAALVAAALLLSATFVSSVASADGLVAKSSDLTTAQRQALVSQINAFRAENPEAFAAVREVEGYKPETYKQFRNPIPMVGRELRRLGPQALLPMLEALAFDVWPRGRATDKEWDALKIGMLEAVGRIGDPRASQVLRAAFRNGHAEGVTRAAAEGMGSLCDAPSFAALQAALSTKTRSSAIAGLGQCRTLESANVLAAEMAATQSARDAALIAKAMGNLGSSWAWEAMGADQAQIGLQVRELLAGSLVRGFVRFDDDASRDAHSLGLGMLALPNLSKLVVKHAGQADAATRTRLDRLAARIERRARR